MHIEIAERIKKWTVEPWGGPFRIVYLPTDRCNLSCLSCRRTAKIVKPDSRDYEVSEERMLELIAESYLLGTREWEIAGGGEPLMRKPSIFKMMEKIKGLGMRGQLTTNGTLFLREDVKFVKEIGWDSLVISLDGPDKSTNDYLRPPSGTFDKILNTLEDLHSLKGALRNAVPQVFIHYVLSSHNINKMAELAQFVAEHGADGVFFNFIRNESELCNPLMVDIQKDRSIIRSQLEAARNIVNTYKLKHNLDGLSSIFNEQSNPKEEASVKAIEEGENRWLALRCYLPFYYLLIEVNGRVSPCCLLNPFSGNVKDKSLKEIWLGNEFNDFRQSVRDRKLPEVCGCCNASLSTDNNGIREELGKIIPLGVSARNITFSQEGKKLSICLISREYPPDTCWGGIGTYTYRLACGLAEAGHETHVICQSLDIDRDYEDHGVHVHRVVHKSFFPLKGKLREFGLRWEYSKSVHERIKEITKKHAIDIVEAPNLSGEAFIFSFYKKIPLVTRLHTHFSEVANFLDWKMTPDRRLSCWFEDAAILRSDMVTCSTKAHAELVAKEVGIDPQKIRIIPLGVNMPAPTISAAKNNIPTVLFVGRLEKRKGIHILIQAIPFVLKIVPQARFVIIGRDSYVSEDEVSFSGPANRSYKEYLLSMLPADCKEKVEFLGHVDDAELKKHYFECSIFVAPSLYESFGQIYIEAMSYGKPVIGCGVGGVPEIIQDGKNGILVPPGDVQRLASALICLLNDPLKCFEMGRNALFTVKEKFSLEKMVQETVVLYDEISQKKHEKRPWTSVK